ncbi:hypothetical protein ACFOZY_08795 [Chungangia koreensis]|uniref:Uncharacterized protein n=1 Tax=Chungangia koreensis TaxID=752657 RepID=A0ABV8X514_9LACT
MNRKLVFGILIGLSSILSLVFIVLRNMDLAVFFMCILFTFTNLSRVYSFREKGYTKEANWMKWMAVVFAIGAVVILYLYLF